MTDRPNVVAFVNNRLIRVEVYEDVLHYTSSADYCGVKFEHEAIVYNEGDAWFCIKLTRMAGTGEGDVWGAEAFLTEKACRNHAFAHCARAQGRRVGV